LKKSPHFLNLLLFLITQLGFTFFVSASDGFFNFSQKLSSGKTDYVIQFWNNTNGLPHNTIYAMEKDEFGFVWLATEEGLVRFDGMETKVYTKENTEALKENSYYRLFPSTRKGIWAAGDYSLVFLQKNVYQVFDFFDIFENTSLASLTEDNNGNLWIGTRHGSIYKFKNGKVEETLTLNGEKSPLINDMVIDQGNLLIATNKGLYKLPLDQKDTAERITEDTFDIVRLKKYKDHILVGVHGSGIYLMDAFFDLQLLLSDSELPDLNYGSLSISHEERVLIGSNNGEIFEVGPEKVREWKFKEIEDFNVRNILADEHHLFIGTVGLGLAVIHQAEIKQFKDHALSTQNIRPILIDSRGNKWIGTASKGVFKVSENSAIGFRKPEGLNNENIVSLAEWKDEIYVGTRAGLHIIDPKANVVKKKYLPKDDFPMEVVYTLHLSRDDKLWFTLAGRGIYYFDEKGNIQQPTMPEHLTTSSFISIYEGENGLLYFGAIDQGLVIFKDGIFQEQLQLPLLPGEQVVYTITQDRDGDLWLGTQGGLLLLKDGVWQVLNRSHGLIANGIFSIIRDNYKHVWISSNFGLQRIPESELKRFKANPSSDFYLNATIFDETQGMGNEETNSYIFPNVAVDAEGQIWYPTIRGISIVDPSKEFANRSYEHFQWDIIRYGDAMLDISGDIEVPAGNNWFIINFSHIDYLNPDQTVFYYRLNGLKEDWVFVGQKRELLFSNLKPGNYTLEVRSLSFGNQEKTHELNIKVVPFFYQTWAFKILLTFFFIFLGAFIYRFTLEKKLGKKLEYMVAIRSKELSEANKSLKNSLLEIERKNQALKEINWQQSHMIRGPLTEAMGLTKLLIKFDNYSYIKKSKQEIYDRISKALEELDEVVREMNEKSENLEKNDV